MANYNMTLTDAIEERTAELEKAQNSLVHAKKMASLGQLTAGIAHEIKNPLNFINNFTETNIDFVNELEGALAGKLDGPDGDEVRDLLADLKENSVIIRKEGEKVSSIIRGMLNQSREDTNAKDEVDINALLHESVNLVYHSARAMRPDTLLDIERQLAAELAPVVANSSQINRVFVNILDNAAYATWEKAKGAGPDYRPLVVIRSREQAGNIVVEIEDNGNGVPEEIRERIFDPFFTTKPAQQGTGLGLKMCYDIIREGHDGSIEIESEPGRFARFIIKIPRQGRHS
jgi:signal transduction histidine kinase